MIINIALICINLLHYDKWVHVVISFKHILLQILLHTCMYKQG